MTDTQQTPIQLKDILTIGGITLLVVLAIPLLAVLGLTLQAGFLVIAPVLLICAVVYALGRRSADTHQRIRGILMPEETFFTKKHSWFKRNARNNILLGLDDFAQRIVGTPQHIEFAKAGRHLNQGDTLATVTVGDMKFNLKSPCKGQVVRTNTDLINNPSWMNQSPYQKAWVAEMVPEEPVFSMNQFLTGEPARTWMRNEVDRLIALVQNVPAQVASLPDGGEVANHFGEHLDEKTRNRVVKEFLDN